MGFWSKPPIAATTYQVRSAGFLAALIISFLLTIPAGASSISYTVAEVDPVANTWQYYYTLGGGPFGVSPGMALSGFDVYFDPSLYANIDGAPLPPNGDWIVFTTPADTSLPADGAYTAQAQVDGASLANPFTVGFTWLGTGTPGSQPFDIFDATFSVVQQGTTGTASSTIPEPASMTILCGAFVALAMLRRHVEL